MPDDTTHPDPELVEQAEKVLELVRATMYPVASGEAARLGEMLDHRRDRDTEE